MGRKAIFGTSALLAISFMTAFTAYAASDFEGTWTVQGRKERKLRHHSQRRRQGDIDSSQEHERHVDRGRRHRHHQMGHRLGDEDQQRRRSLHEAVRHR